MSREIGFRYELLRDGAYCALLRAETGTAPSIRMQEAGEIKTAFSGVFAPAAEDVDGNPVEIDWLSDEIRPVLLIDGEAYPLGVFMPVTPRNRSDGVVSSVRVEAYDRCWRVRDTNSDSLLYWPAGTRYLDAVEQLLTAAGIVTVLRTDSDAVFATAREDWDIGTGYLTVINDLLGEINYNPLWFNAEGAAVLEPRSVPEESAIEHTLDASDPGTLVRLGISRETDIYSAPNVFIVVCANPELSSVMTSTAINDNPQSPLSVSRRGRRICTVVHMDNIADQDALDACAAALRDESLITGETVQVTTGLLPGFGVDDVVALHYGDLTDVCVERAFTMELAVGGKMTHTLERVVYNLA